MLAVLCRLHLMTDRSGGATTSRMQSSNNPASDDIDDGQQQQQEASAAAAAAPLHDESISSRHEPIQQDTLDERLQPSKGVTIGATDVLCGRGKTSFNHVGNKRFRDAVNNALSDYLRASNRYEKSLVVHGIVDEIKSAGGRFLKNNYSTGEWFELPDQQAKEKVGHAVRDAVAASESRKKKKKKPRAEKKPPPGEEPAGEVPSLHQAFASLSSSAGYHHRHAVAQPSTAAAASSGGAAIGQQHQPMHMSAVPVPVPAPARSSSARSSPSTGGGPTRVEAFVRSASVPIPISEEGGQAAAAAAAAAAAVAEPGLPMPILPSRRLDTTSERGALLQRPRQLGGVRRMSAVTEREAAMHRLGAEPRHRYHFPFGHHPMEPQQLQQHPLREEFDAPMHLPVAAAAHRPVASTDTLGGSLESHRAALLRRQQQLEEEIALSRFAGGSGPAGLAPAAGFAGAAAGAVGQGQMGAGVGGNSGSEDHDHGFLARIDAVLGPMPPLPNDVIDEAVFDEDSPETNRSAGGGGGGGGVGGQQHRNR